jgi:hypothetical protein
VRPLDTSPEAHRVQLDLLRKATPAKRASLARSLSRFTMRLSRSALRRARPEASERDIDLAFVELCYGRDLAERLRTYLAARLE